MATIKQKKAFKEVLNGSTITKAMVKADYALTTASSTGKLTRTKGWEELMEKHLPDRLLAKKHKELLEKKEIVITQRKTPQGEKVYEVLEQPETNAVKAGLDMAYKLKGRYVNEESQGNKTLILVVSGESAKRYDITRHPENHSE